MDRPDYITDTDLGGLKLKTCPVTLTLSARNDQHHNAGLPSPNKIKGKRRVEAPYYGERFTEMTTTVESAGSQANHSTDALNVEGFDITMRTQGIRYCWKERSRWLEVEGY